MAQHVRMDWEGHFGGGPAEPAHHAADPTALREDAGADAAEALAKAFGIELKAELA
jgi:hypothetical protein